jgi:cell wall-associated NlpC family hydrolase
MQKIFLLPVVKKFLFLPLVTLLSTIGGISKSLAQTSVNGTKNIIKSLKFIESVEFTPQPVGFTQVPSRITGGEAVKMPLSGRIPSKNAPSGFTVNIEEINPLQFKYALMLDVPVEEVTATGLYEHIEDWYGTRYRYGGEGRSGIDCSAFTRMLVNSSYAVALPRTAHQQYAASMRVDYSELKEGDLVFFNTRGGISHVGVYLHNGRFVHASSSRGVMISDLSDGYYHSRYIGAGRVKP